MIRKFIDRLLGKPAAADAASVAAAAPSGPALGERAEFGAEQHKIDPRLVHDQAVKVVRTLKDAGHEAYIVGGAVRDLLVGLEPKDFDVATDATPEQVKALFRRAFIVGRRFRLVHVVFGRGREHEKIEVSTFRAYVDPADAAPVPGNEKTSKDDLAGRSHAVDASGRVLRDNVWGPQIEDAARRDITVNAMYYDPQTRIVVDYHGGMADSKAKLLRMIGDPEVRYREDPVRIIRVLRFAAKMGYRIEPRTEAPIRKMKSLLANVPSSRMFDEMIKLLQTGHALASLEVLKAYGLDRGVFPILDAHFEAVAGNPARAAFVDRALADTDRRVGEGKPVAPSFLLACMFWHDVSARWQQLREQGEAPTPALQAAIDATFDARIGDISGRGRIAGDMRDIWMMQPRFDKRTGSAALSLVQQARFRAAFDFMRLRAEAGEVDASLADWWESFSLADEATRDALLETARAAAPPRRERAAPRDPRPLKAPRAEEGPSAAPAAAAEAPPAPARAASPARQQLQQLAATARAAFADRAEEADRAALLAMLANLPPLPDAGAPPTVTQQLLRELAETAPQALVPGASAETVAAARALADKLEKRAAASRRRRGGRRRGASASAESGAGAGEADAASRGDDDGAGEDGQDE
jgi:poly(A) polymerase